jgi:nucleotide-binding universal stress UspA family protein
VLHKSPCPVLAVPPASERRGVVPFGRILCPLDFSPASATVLAHAVALAREGAGRVTLLHVVETLAAIAPNDLHLGLGEYLRRQEDEAREQLRRRQGAEDASVLETEPLVASGRARTEILRVAKQRGFDLIVMGVDGRDAIGRLFFGSTARHVVRHAPCPVFVVRGVAGKGGADLAGEQVAGANAESVV